MSFRIGEAFVEIGLKDPTAAEEEATRRRIEDSLGRQPAKIPVKAEDPINAAFRAKLQADLKAAARELTKVPVDADTERFGRELAEKIRGIEELLSVDIPMDVADAAKWRARVIAEAKAVSESVKARIPVEVEVSEPEVKKAEGTLKKFVLGAAAVVGPSGAVGAALVGTSALFAGLGAYAASADETVSREFGMLGDRVSTSVTQMGQRVVPTLLRIEDTAEEAFGRLEPVIERAITAANPMIESLADGVIGFAERAVPRMVNALEDSGPVVDAFSHGITVLGDGVGGLLEGMAHGAPGAAAGLDTLLGGVSAILPPLGQMLGSWANISGQVLHNLAPGFTILGGVLKGVSGVLDHTGGLLTPIATGAVLVWTGFRLWTGITGIATRARTSIAGVAAETRVATAAAAEGAVANAALGRSLGLMSTGFGAAAAGAAFAIPLISALNRAENNTAAVDKYTKALLDGGDAAGKAGQKLQEAAQFAEMMAAKNDRGQRTIDNTKRSLDEQLGSLGATSEQVDKVNKAWDDYIKVARDSHADTDVLAVRFTALQTAIANAKAPLDPFNTALGTASDDMSQAALDADKLDQELQGVARASASVTLGLQRQQAVQDAFAADISLRSAIDATNQAQSDYNDTLKHHTAGSQEAKQASDQLLSAMEGQARAASAAAQAHYTGTDAEGKAAAGATAYRQTLVDLSTHASGPLKQALLDTITKLDQAAKPRTTDLYADIDNAISGIAKARAGYNSLPPGKKTLVDADIAALQNKVAIAIYELNKIHSKTVGINVNVVVHGDEIIVGKLGVGAHAFATGGIARATSGGLAARVAEAGDDEAVIPLNDWGAEYLRKAMAPWLPPMPPAGSAAAMPFGQSAAGQTVNHFHYNIQVNASQLSDMQRVITFFDRLPQVARAGGFG